MRDGMTRKMKSTAGEAFDAFQQLYRAKLVVVDGAQLGMEYLLDAPRKTIGRGPGVDLLRAASGGAEDRAPRSVGERSVRR